MKTARQKAEEFVSSKLTCGSKGEHELWVGHVVTLLKEQDRDTRHACAEAVITSDLSWTPKREMDEVIATNMAHSIIMNARGIV